MSNQYCPYIKCIVQMNKFLFLLTIILITEQIKMTDSNVIVPSKTNTNSIDDTALYYTCYDIYGYGYIGQIPHPYHCHNYLMCIERNGEPIPQLQICQVQNQVFDMISCKCIQRENELCFDMTNPEHESKRFKCAEPVRTLKNNSHGQ